MERSPGLFPANATIRKVDSEIVLLLGGGRALLMQLAHPLVARGVADHSGFRADPLARLRRTLDVVYTVVFGSIEEAHSAVAALDKVHQRVRGPGYSATDPVLMLWVHATLVDTALRVHRRFLGTLDATAMDRYYAESVVLGEVLGLPAASQPPDLAAFRAYVRHTIGGLTVSDEARRLASEILHPRVPWPAGPLLEPVAVLARQVTVGLLPPPLRQGYGLSWDPGRQAALDAASAAVRAWLPHVPPVLRRVRAA